MNKAEIAAELRNEVGELQGTIDKLQKRCDGLKRFVLDLEAEIEAANGPKPKRPEVEGRIRKVIDKVFGETPKRPKSR